MATLAIVLMACSAFFSTLPAIVFTIDMVNGNMPPPPLVLQYIGISSGFAVSGFLIGRRSKLINEWRLLVNFPIAGGAAGIVSAYVFPTEQGMLLLTLSGIIILFNILNPVRKLQEDF